MIVPEKHSFARAEIHHLFEEVAVLGFRVADVVVLFLYKAEVVRDRLIPTVAFFPSVAELFGRNVEKSERAGSIVARFIRVYLIFIPIDLLV